jgi:N-acyl-L-homoserine lactone synthetase
LHKFVADGLVLKRGLATAPYELFAGMIEFGLSRQLTDIVSVTDARMERILRRAGWPLRRMSFAENWHAIPISTPSSPISTRAFSTSSPNQAIRF